MSPSLYRCPDRKGTHSGGDGWRKCPRAAGQEGGLRQCRCLDGEGQSKNTAHHDQVQRGPGSTALRKVTVKSLNRPQQKKSPNKCKYFDLDIVNYLFSL